MNHAPQFIFTRYHWHKPQPNPQQLRSCPFLALLDLSNVDLPFRNSVSQLTMPISPPLSVGVGYGVVLGLGFAFALGMILTTFVLKRYNREVQTSEMFSTAGRTVKSGLVASAVVSSWTWAATLLQSSGIAYRYGVSGPFWYASGATVQILLFATLAIELKRKAPNAHTFLEIIRARYGVYAHIVFTVFGLMTNILVCFLVGSISNPFNC